MEKRKDDDYVYKTSALWTILVGSFAIYATPASADVLTAATATMRCGCDRSTILVSAAGLSVGTAYVIDYSVTVTPSSGPAVTITSQIQFMATAATENGERKDPARGLASRDLLAERYRNSDLLRKHDEHHVHNESLDLFAVYYSAARLHGNNVELHEL